MKGMYRQVSCAVLLLAIGLAPLPALAQETQEPPMPGSPGVPGRIPYGKSASQRAINRAKTMKARKDALEKGKAQKSIERVGSKSAARAMPDDVKDHIEAGKVAHEEVWENCDKRMKRGGKKPAMVLDVGITYDKDGNTKWNVAGDKRDAVQMARQGKCPEKPKEGDGGNLAREGKQESRFPITFERPKKTDADESNAPVEPGAQ
jgi:hypothetical protein